MIKFLLPAFLAAFFAFANPVQAADTDVAKITCKELLASNEAEIGLFIMWIDGYMSAMSENTIISDEWLEQLGTHIGSYCATNPSKTIMDAMDAME